MDQKRERYYTGKVNVGTALDETYITGFIRTMHDSFFFEF